MGPGKFLALFVSMVILAGCSSIMGQSRMEYQDGRSVTPGQTYADYKGLFSVTFPYERYYIERSYSRMAFIPKDAWTVLNGPFAIKVFPRNTLPRSYRNDIMRIFDLLQRKEIGRKAFRRAVTLRQELKDFRGRVAFFRQFFVPEGISRNFDGERIKVPARGYAGVVFENNDYIYWIVHSDPIDEMVLEGKKISPRVEQKTVDRLYALLDGFSFDVKK